MTHRYNPQKGANMVDRYIGSAFDIVYAVYKHLSNMPVFLEFVNETSPRMEEQYADIIDRFVHIVELEASALNSKVVAVQAAGDALEYRDTTQALIDDANEFREFVENVVENTIQDIQDRFAEFVVASGYQFIGNYGPGIEITEYNQLVRDLDGEFWRLSGERTLPYVTTGVGIVEEDAFIPVGDASLRQHLKNPTLGSVLVQYDENNTVKDAIDRNKEDFWAIKETLGGVYTHYVREDDGDPISGAECAVYVGGTGVLATNLRDKHGAPLANPFTTGEVGLVQFIADPGNYTLQVSFDLIVHTYSVYFADDGLRNDLANPDSGAELIAYKDSTVRESLETLEQFNADLANPSEGANLIAYGNKSVSVALDQVAVVDYAPGITLVGYNQLVRDENGEFWRVSGQTALPYTTTGAGVDEGGALSSVGDAALRQALLEGGGSSLVGTHSGKTVSESLEAAYGVSSDFLGLQSTGDMTAILNSTAKNHISEVNADTLILDKKITVDGLLDPAYANVAFNGPSVTYSDKANSLELHRRRTSKVKSHSSKINFSPVFSDRFYAAARKNKSVKIVLFGDSISVGPDFDSANAANTGKLEVGVDNPQHNNSLAKTIYNELLSVLPSDVRVRLYCRSVPGYSYAQIDQPWDGIFGGPEPWTGWIGREQVVPGKSWRDCVIDLDPDLVIHSMGMNHNSESFVQNFMGKWDDYLRQKKKSKSFDQVMLTTPNPYFGLAGPHGDFRGFDINASKIYLNAQQRQLASRLGYSVIDVGAFNIIKRYGFEPRSVTMDMQPSRHVASRTLGSWHSMDITHPSRPFYAVYKFDYKLLGTPEGSSNDFRLTVGSAILQITPSSITIYPKVGSYYEPYESAPFVFTANKAYEIKVEILPSLMAVYVDSVPIVMSRNTLYSETLDATILNRLDVSVEISGVEVFAQHFPRLTADTPSKDYFGNVWWAHNEFGGGVNHPSAAALAELYLPPIREFLIDALAARSQPSTKVSNPLNGLVFIGVASSVNNEHCIFEAFGHGFTVTKTSSGYVVSNMATRNRVVVTADGRVFIKIDTGTGVISPSWSGNWLVRTLVAYPSSDNVVDGGTIFELPNYPLVPISKTVNGITTVMGAVDADDGTPIKIHAFPINDIAVVSAHGYVVAKGGQDNLPVARLDSVDVSVKPSGITFKYIFNGPTTSEMPRRCFFEYTYCTN